jgi:hypothetical protein
VTRQYLATLDVLVWLIALFAALSLATSCSTTTVTPPQPVVIEVTCTCTEQVATETVQEQPQEPVVSLIATRRDR